MQTIVLRTANECNLRCRYCYDSKNHKNSLSQIRKNASDLFAKNSNQLIKDIRLLTKNSASPVIIFHGGEPLLVDCDILDKFCKELEGFRFHIQTNATLIDKKTIDLFKKYNFHVGISLDGADKKQNSDRIFLNGKSSFDTVIKKIHIMKQENIKFGIVMSINKNHIGAENKIYEFLSKEKLQCNIRPVFASDNSKLSNIMSVKEYIDFWCRLFDIWFEDEKEKVGSWQVHEFVQEICKVKIISFREKSCECSQNCFENFISLDIDGNLYSCNRLYGINEFYYGNIRKDNIETINDKIKELTQNRIEAIEKKCGKCSFYTYCYGGCPAEAYDSFGDINGISQFCLIRQAINKHVKYKIM